MKIEPLPRNSGIQFEDATVGGSVPKEYIPAVERGVRDAASNGVLAGFPVVDCKVTPVSYTHLDRSDQVDVGVLLFDALYGCFGSCSRD